MCGIFASIAPPGTHCAWASSAVSLMQHRGPDAQGTAAVHLPWATVSLGQARLKIVDQSHLIVPWVFPRLGIVLAYNGEIYNWSALADELGHDWETRCDVEVLAAAWRRWGEDCLDRLNGMWAFVLVDTIKHEIYAVRDRAGEKPLYWAEQGDCTYLASEVKALPVALEETPCPDMDALEFDFGVSTPFKSVQALAPGSLMRWVPERTERQWWALPTEVDDDMELLEARQTALDLVTDAIWIRGNAEVPVAVQLSGGLDSAIVQAVVRSDRLYCVDFPAEVDNLTAARVAAQGCDVIPVTFSWGGMLGALSDIAYHLDTPATWTAACQWFLDRAIAADGAKIVLSGEGADELFGGYSRYRILWHLDQMLADPHLAAYRPTIERTLGPVEWWLVRLFNRHGAPCHVRSLLAEGPSLVDRAWRTDFLTTMQVLLRMADRMAMAHSLENRSPFFDFRLMELAARMPVRYKIGSQSKAILRWVATEVGVPAPIVNEQTKRGLIIPPSWGAGANWDRRWYADLSKKLWQERCLRPALCYDRCMSSPKPSVSTGAPLRPAAEAGTSKPETEAKPDAKPALSP